MVIKRRTYYSGEANIAARTERLKGSEERIKQMESHPEYKKAIRKLQRDVNAPRRAKGSGRIKKLGGYWMDMAHDITKGLTKGLTKNIRGGKGKRGK